MREIRNVIFFLFVINILSFTEIKSQVSGISASKLATYNTDVVPNRNIEFEPAFQALWSSSFFDNEGNIVKKDFGTPYTDVDGEMSFRFTYGLLDIIELGMSVPTSGEAISIGTKYNFLKKEKWSMAAIVGYNKALSNIEDKNNISYDKSGLIAGGLVSSLQFTESLSLDIDGQFQKSVNKTIEDHSIDIFFDADLGYYVFDWLQPVAGLNYGKSYFNVPDPSPFPANISEMLLNLGFTIEPAKQFLMVINMPFSLAGKNTDKAVGFGFALTITLE